MYHNKKKKFQISHLNDSTILFNFYVNYYLFLFNKNKIKKKIIKLQIKIIKFLLLKISKFKNELLINQKNNKQIYIK